ncbi:MAG TPA: sulfite exporter TauE/SafE family protein [Chitinophagaceae bacterium]|jgi:sulfite exporter TauE/SafE|nr:sulfite exporter TauE/SafE family protein [Chitinophagaceae bacterium]
MPVSIEVIVSAFIMGFAGSLHCIGMCGPLALSLPVSHNNNLSRITGAAIYNSGRIVSYTILGLIFGSLGGLIIAPKWQSGLSLALGVVILLYLLLPKRYFHLSANNSFNKPFLLLRQQLGKLFHSKKQSSILAIGILNGFLPCGLVYLALSSSVISASSMNGGMFMLFFGLGTFPAMFTTVIMGNYINQTIRLKLRKAVPVLLFFMATLLILRGMELGIPFVSPSFVHGSAAAVSCH